MNPLAEELNATIKEASPVLFGTLSSLGRELFFPKGILTQTAEAKEGAHRFNATIGIAREGGEAMHLDTVMKHVKGLSADQVLDYAPSTGNAALRKRWLEDMMVKNPSLAGKRTSLPVTTAGVTHALTVAGELFIDPGDVVVLPDKFWGNYNMCFGTRRGAELRKFPLFDGRGGFDTAGFEKVLATALAEKGKALVLLNFPNNPTGYSISRSEADGIIGVLTEACGPDMPVVVLLDDAYFGLYYEDGVFDESLFGLLAGLSPNLFPVKLDGVTKEEYAWGLRVGFITFSVEAGGREDEVHTALEKKVGGTIRGNVSNCSQLSQSLALAVLQDPDFTKQRAGKYRVMKARAVRVREVLSSAEFADAWEPYPFNAGYFMCLRLKGADSEAVRRRLLSEYGVGVIAEGGTDLRIAFSCLEVDDIAELFGIIYRCVKEVQGD